MIKVPHTIELVTELDETNPTVQRMLALPEGMLNNMMVAAFIGLVNEEGFFDKVNAKSSWAVLKFAKDAE